MSCDPFGLEKNSGGDMAWRAETPRPTQPAEMRWNMWDEDSRMDETPVYLHRSLVEAAWRNQTWQKYIINWYIEKALRLARNDKTNKQNSDNDIYIYIYIGNQTPTGFQWTCHSSVNCVRNRIWKAPLSAYLRIWGSSTGKYIMFGWPGKMWASVFSPIYVIYFTAIHNVS